MSFSTFSQHIPMLAKAAASPSTLTTLAGGLEAGIHAVVQFGEKITSTSIKPLRATITDEYLTIQNIFTAINIGTTLYYSKLLIDAAQSTFCYTVIDLATCSALAGMGSIFGVATLTTIAAACVLVTLAPSSTESKKYPSTEGELALEISVSDARSDNTFANQMFETSKLILNIAVACLSSNKLFLIINAASASYSLYRLLKTRWLTFTFDKDIAFSDGRIGTLTTHYQVLARTSDSKELCPICLDDDTTYKIYVCSNNHVFHENCITTCLAHSARKLGDVRTDNIMKTAHFFNGAHTHTSYSTTVKLPENKLPSCPTCRARVGFPTGYDLSVPGIPHIDTHFTLLRDREPSTLPYFQAIYAAYSLAESGLTFLQQYPELAAPIYTIHYILQAGHIIAGAFTCGYLFEEISKKISPYFDEDNVDLTTAGIVVASVVSSLAISIIGERYLFAFMRPSSDLNKLLSTGGVDHEHYSLSWGKPASLGFLHIVHLNQAILSLLLAAISQTKTGLLTVASTLFTTYQLSRMTWIQVDLTTTDVYKTVQELGGKFLRRSSILWNSLNLQIKPLFFTNTSGENASLVKTVKEIAETMNHFFEGAQFNWYRYLKKGAEVGDVVSLKIANDLFHIMPNQLTALFDLNISHTPYFLGEVAENVWDTISPSNLYTALIKYTETT